MKGTIKKRRHGLARHPLYTTWASMIYSCYNSNFRNFKYIGALGITVCERWLLVENFIEDIGTKKKGMCFTRKDDSDDFNPNNWEWTPRKELVRNSKAAKLNKEQVLAIRKERMVNDYSYYYLAKKYNCSEDNIYSIINNKTWAN